MKTKVNKKAAYADKLREIFRIADTSGDTVHNDRVVIDRC